MNRRILLIIAGVGMAVLCLVLLNRPTPCYACAQSVPPPQCTANMSAMTVRKADDRRVWWQLFDRRDERTLRVYLGLNMNNGVADTPYSYEIVPSGAWMPTTITPITGTGMLSPGKNNTTIEVTLPYSITDAGDLNLTANISSPCPFSPQRVETSVRINDQGPTVWPITSRTCPTAGEKPRFRFGIRNPSDQPQTYRVSARALTQFGGDHTPVLNDDSAQPGVHQFPDMTLKPGESQEVVVTCETFGFCLTGSESRVNLEVQPASGSEQFPGAVASSNVTVRDPGAFCPNLEDWWFIMPPAVLWGLIGLGTAPVLAAVGWYFRPRKITGAKDQDGPRGPGKRRDNIGKSVDRGDNGGSAGGSTGATKG